MPEKQIDVFGVGNAMVDILAMVTDDFVREHAINRGTMTLVDAEKQGALLQDLERHDLQMQSGGSAANTMIAIAQSGGTGFYSGKVSRDTNGEFYRQDMLESGIHFDVHPAPETGAPTGTCLVLTTPDAERTMCTHLGISTELSPSDIDLDRLARCKYAYIEGYLWDPPQPRAASTAVMEAAKRLDVKVSLTYSDPFLMERFGDDFRRVTAEFCDIIFCNADEAKHLTGAADLDGAARKLSEWVELAFITDGPNGCRVVQGGHSELVAGYSVQAIDTVGAGDAFAGGVLYGLSRGYEPQRAARWGNYLASRVVTHQGARLPHAVEHLRDEILG
ncbi:MAG: adenosine kinase [Planctomycetales bacterium]|nr:adenosine kinase [Planctomycetales bacterium]MCA9167365.1 adenosine kinase [Planctomycetales bacterium]